PLDHPVEDDDVRSLLLGEQQRLLAVRRASDLELLAGEMPDQQLGQRPVVLDEQQFALAHAAFSTIGRRTWTVVPFPSSLSKRSRPRCRSTICLTIDRPSPVP